MNIGIDIDGVIIDSIKTIVLDLDGTLLRSDKTISSITMNTLNKVKEKNIEIILATARPPRAVYNFLPEELLDGKIIFYNGAEIHDKKLKIYSQDISSRDFETLHNSVLKYTEGISIAYEYNDQCYVSGNFERHFPEIFYEKVDSFQYREVPKILVDIKDKKFKDYLINNVPSGCTMVLTDKGTLAQIMHINVSKKNAVSYLLDKYGGSFENTICFGDDFNDIEMFKACGISVAMGNAVSELKGVATNITETNDRDGVASFLNECFNKCI
ncbi:MAG: HAD family hydrolase [Halanaerobiales bacterium]